MGTGEKKEVPETIMRGTVKNRKKGETIVDLFEQCVLNYPDNIAVKDGERELSYEQLSFFVTKIARYVRTVKKQSNRIAIVSENSAESVIAVMGVLRAGAAYVPLDIKGGVYRNECILLDSQPDLILISKKYWNKVMNAPEWERVANLLKETFQCVLIEDVMNSQQDELKEPLERVKSNDCAYVIYTSGSTGVPKGVGVLHYNLVNFIAWAKEEYVTNMHFEKPVMFPLYASIAFDMTGISLLVPLISGNGIVTYDLSNSGYAISKVIKDNIADILILTPSQLRILEELDVRKSRLKVIITGGESLKSSVARKICGLFSNRITFFNLYGPTETTIGCTSHKFDMEKDTKSTVSLGKPIDNVDIYLLREDMTPAQIGEVGEIYVAGVNVTDGYINKKDLTENCFVDDIYAKETGRMYKTNDLAVLYEDGDLIFSGRNGYRIELEEIESFLVQHKSVKEAAVILIHEEKLDSICACIVAKENCTGEDLKRYLMTRLPLYMLPRKYVFLQSMPYTVNGKIDRKKLSHMELETN